MHDSGKDALTRMEGRSEEVRRLQGCINDLVSLLALPAIWLGRGPLQARFVGTSEWGQSTEYGLGTFVISGNGTFKQYHEDDRLLAVSKWSVLGGTFTLNHAETPSWVVNLLGD
ncbi:hypothetical protein AYO47_05265 [Planctomyces sp. SCGC AG-212-M04]|nr:hypothetical protein AYO47_05265 [Planctomyces sp. SCGC AG-212-M04]